ncbi:MAG: hypothetical protein WC531_02675 [Candidatus Paceibacterota bacterium]|jgi:hypothetical protein
MKRKAFFIALLLLVGVLPATFLLAEPVTKKELWSKMLKFEVTSTKPAPLFPIIKTISPLSGDDRTVFTITGANFDFSGNQVKTTYNTINNISSSDGQTLVFPTGLFSDVFDLVRSNSSVWGKSVNLPVSLWVENSQGRSNQITFYLKFKP